MTAISPVDGRYAGKTQPLRGYFSEAALIKYRVRVEVEYFLRLVELPLPPLEGISGASQKAIKDIWSNFSLSDAERVKGFESITNHDVKAVEYFIKEKFDEIENVSPYKEYVHFGLTSQDINNTAMPLMVKEALQDVLYPQIEKLINTLETYATEWAEVSLLAHTHGQPASPTRLGKEVMVFVYRLKEQLEGMKALPITAKFSGATGNFNAHHVAFPQVDWKAFADAFIESLGLRREQYTTQISNYDALASIFDALKRINTILVDLDRDFWMYISMDYFKQKIKEGEVGSSAMPHKVNPIDFENSEGNLLLANAILAFLSQKLPISRLQRDLTDSTVTRNIGVPFAHTLIALDSTMKGIEKLILNPKKIMSDLEDNWAVVAEAVQTILRRENFPQPYEALKALTRTNEKVTRDTFIAFIDSLDIADEVKQELKSISPSNYTGI